MNVLQIVILVVSVLVVWSTSYNIANKHGLPVINQLLSWTILIGSFLLPLLSDTNVYRRLLSISLSVIPVYLLLSMSHEGLFVVVLCLLCACWLQLENQAVFKVMCVRLTRSYFQVCYLQIALIRLCLQVAITVPFHVSTKYSVKYVNLLI